MLDLWDMNVTQQPAMRHPQKQTAPRPREVVYCDWDTEELDAVAKHGLTYTIRSSKYPRYATLNSSLIRAIQYPYHYTSISPHLLVEQSH